MPQHKDNDASLNGTLRDLPRYSAQECIALCIIVSHTMFPYVHVHVDILYVHTLHICRVGKAFFHP